MCKGERSGVGHTAGEEESGAAGKDVQGGRDVGGWAQLGNKIAYREVYSGEREIMSGKYRGLERGQRTIKECNELGKEVVKPI